MNVSEEVSPAILEPSKPQHSANRTAVLFGAAVTAAATLLFYSLYWNKYAGLRSGNGSFMGGMALLSGLRPYRDFFTAGPPLNAVLSAAVMGLFGKELIVIRALGVFERVAMALLLYSWLARLFRARHAALASIVTLAVCAGDPSNPLSSYSLEASLAFLGSGFFAALAFERIDESGWFFTWAVLAGLLAGLSLGTKQTLGMGATVGIPLLSAIYVFRLRGIRKTVVFLASFAIGWCLVAATVLLWLAQIGATHAFLTDVFEKGPSAKASHLIDFLTRAAHAAWQLRWGFFSACIAVPLVWRSLRKAGEANHPRSDTGPGSIRVAVLACLSIALGAAASYSGRSLFKITLDFAIYVAFLGTCLLLVYYGARLVRGMLSEREARICFLAGIAFGISCMVALSWPASFDMVYPAFGLIAAGVLDGSSRIRAYIAYALCSVLLIAATCSKLNQPSGFHEWFEPPVRFSTSHSRLPELKGLLLPETMVHFIDDTVDIIQKHSSSQDTIFVCPELGIFYDLAGRSYPTKTDSHNIDVVDDEFARSEARRVLQARPAAIVYFPAPEWSLRADEKLWRHGKRSGQRDLIAAVETLVKDYHLAATFDVPPNAFKVMVYVRR